jgi:1-aminocyclopropane-1-carboxylate deaminase
LIEYSDPGISEFVHAGVNIRVLHEYQNHHAISGNKWWKLKTNLEQAKKNGCHTIITFGGAYSNHIYATAAAAKAEGFRSIGIIRGEEVENPVLSFARSQEMELRFVTREEYREMRGNDVEVGGTRRSNDEVEGTRRRRAPNEGVYVIPEGGTNRYAVEACAEWGRKLLKLEFDQLYLPVGTGGTMAGLVIGTYGEREIVGVPVLKNTGFMEEAVSRWIGGEAGDTPVLKNTGFMEEAVLRWTGGEAGDTPLSKNTGFVEEGVPRRIPGETADTRRNWRLLNEYHHGGYAKTTRELIDFCASMKSEYQLIVEPVYTGKLFWAVFDQIKKGLIKKGTTILVIHTGGIQLVR